MDKRIVEFIDKQKTATLCCLDDENNPYCFSVFYVFDKVERRLYFKSSSSSNHSKYLLKHRKISGTILPDNLNMLAIRGIQFTGFILHNSDSLNNEAEYHKRFPVAMTIPGEVWAIQLETIKMTDSTIGFGKKFFWEREDLYEEIC